MTSLRVSLPETLVIGSQGCPCVRLGGFNFQATLWTQYFYFSLYLLSFNMNKLRLKANLSTLRVSNSSTWNQKSPAMCAERRKKYSDLYKTFNFLKSCISNAFFFKKKCEVWFGLGFPRHGFAQMWQGLRILLREYVCSSPVLVTSTLESNLRE